MKKYENNEDVIVLKGRYNKEYNKKSASEEFRKSIEYKPETPSKNNDDRFRAMAFVKPGLDRFAVGEGSYKRRQENEKEQLKGIHKRREEREKKRKKIKGLTAILLAGTLTVGAGGITISKLHDKITLENRAKLEQIDLTEKEKVEYGFTDIVLAQKDEILFNLNDVDKMSNQELIELAQKINNYQNSIYKAKLHSAFENCSIHYNSSRYTKDADYVYATVEVDSTSPEASKNIKNGLYKVPKKFDDYVIATEKFYNEIENAKMSDFKRKELKEKMQKEYNMANDMLYMDLNVDKKGLKLKEITTKGIEKAREKEKPKTIIIDDNGKEHEINDDDAR